jgi:transposase
MSIDDSLPTDLASAHAFIIAQPAALSEARREAQHRALLIEKLKYTIKKLRHEQFGQSSERGTLLDQLELQLIDLKEDAAEADTAAEMTAEKITVASFERRKPAAASAASTFAARAHRLSRAFGLPMLRR